MGRNDADLELVERCVRGDPGAWREFVDRFGGVLLALARRYMRLHEQFPDQAELEDVVQDVFVALARGDYRLLRNYDPTYTVTTYLGVITRTQVHRALRKRRPVVGAPEALERAAPGEGRPDALEREEEKDRLARALEALPPRDAEILRLRFLREMDYRAIAAALRMPEASVGQTLTRAKQRLLEKLRTPEGAPGAVREGPGEGYKPVAPGRERPPGLRE